MKWFAQNDLLTVALQKKPFCTCGQKTWRTTVKKFIFNKVADFSPTTQLQINSLTDIFQGFGPQLENSCTAEQLFAENLINFVKHNGASTSTQIPILILLKTIAHFYFDLLY